MAAQKAEKYEGRMGEIEAMEEIINDLDKQIVTLQAEFKINWSNPSNEDVKKLNANQLKVKALKKTKKEILHEINEKIKEWSMETATISSASYFPLQPDAAGEASDNDDEIVANNLPTRQTGQVYLNQDNLKQLQRQKGLTEEEVRHIRGGRKRKKKTKRRKKKKTKRRKKKKTKRRRKRKNKTKRKKRKRKTKRRRKKGGLPYVTVKGSIWPQNTPVRIRVPGVPGGDDDTIPTWINHL
jgi:hypothetical protein